ncbi:MAG: hypothetical protein ABGW69_03650 [Nanoarchaeota archaeon]
MSFTTNGGKREQKEKQNKGSSLLLKGFERGRKAALLYFIISILNIVFFIPVILLDIFGNNIIGIALTIFIFILSLIYFIGGITGFIYEILAFLDIIKYYKNNTLRKLFVIDLISLIVIPIISIVFLILSFAFANNILLVVSIILLIITNLLLFLLLILRFVIIYKIYKKTNIKKFLHYVVFSIVLSIISIVWLIIIELLFPQSTLIEDVSGLIFSLFWAFISYLYLKAYEEALEKVEKNKSSSN